MTGNEIGILGNAVRLLQVEGGFHTGLDAVMLAAACPAKDNTHILDLGSGVGGAGLAALHRLPEATLTGVEIQTDHVDFAIKNAALNDMDARTEFICTDIRDFNEQRFDHVICNPPYMEAGAHAPSPSAKRAKALGHDSADIAVEDWVNCAFDCLKGQGSLTMIHRADMVQKIILAIGKRFGALQIIPLWPRVGVPAKRVIIRCWKHKKSPAELHPGIVLHNDDGRYTKVAESILRSGAPIS